MTIESAVMTYLLAQPTLTALIGSHLFSEEASTQAAEQLRQGSPYCVFSLPDDAVVEHMLGVTTLHDAQLRVEVFAITPGARKAVADAISMALHAWKTQQAGHLDTDIRYAKVQSASDEFIAPTDGSEKGIYQRSLDVRLWYRTMSE